MVIDMNNGENTTTVNPLSLNNYPEILENWLKWLKLLLDVEYARITLPP